MRPLAALRRGTQGAADARVPCVGILRPLAMIAADDQPVLGARHADIEQTAVFVVGEVAGHKRGGIGHRVPDVRAGAPEPALAAPEPAGARKRHQPRQMRIAERGRTAVDQEHHRSFQALGGMDGHDAHLVAALVHLALDLGAGIVERGEEGAEARQAGALLGQAEIHEFIEDLAGFRSEPGDHLRAHAVARQTIGIEFEDRPEGCLVRPCVELRDDGGQCGIGFGPTAQRTKQRKPGRALGGQRQQPVFRDIEDRRAQHGGERQVVLRLEKESAERGEVLDCYMGGKLQPVRARDRNPLFLQAARQSVDEAVALAHQHHHVAGLEPSALPLQQLAIRKPEADRLADLLGKPHGRRAGMVDGQRPVVGLFDGLRTQRGPDLDIPRCVVADRLVVERVGIVTDAAPHGFIGEDAVNRLEHVASRAERPGELQVGESGIAATHTRGEELPAFMKRLRRRPLKGIDRLLLVANREDGAGNAVARAMTGEELLGQPAHDLPLLGAGVLRLVEQDVVDALVKLVLHPRPGVGARQKVDCAHDQIVEIEEAAAALDLLVSGDQPIGDGERGACAFEHAKQRQPVAGFHDGGRGVEVAFRQVGKSGEQRLLERLAGIVWHAVRLQKPVGQEFQAAYRIGFGEGRHRMRQYIVENGARVAGVGRSHEVREVRRLKTRKRPDAPRDLRCRLAVREAEFLEQRPEPIARPADLEDEAAQGVALAHDLGEQRIEPGLAGPFQHGGEGLREFGIVAGARAGDHVAAGRGEQRPLHLRVEHLEVGGDVRLQRELVQHRLAEGVDRLDFQTARRLQRFGEQAARPPQRTLVRRPAVELGYPLRQRLVGEDRPFRKHGKDAGRHVGSGGARIGQAQDLRRVGAAQEEPHHAVRQHMRLAGAGIGRNPGGLGRVGGARLDGKRVLGDAKRALHASPSPPSGPSPPASHSAVRARWS